MPPRGLFGLETDSLTRTLKGCIAVSYSKYQTALWSPLSLCSIQLTLTDPTQPSSQKELNSLLHLDLCILSSGQLKLISPRRQSPSVFLHQFLVFTFLL